MSLNLITNQNVPAYCGGSIISDRHVLSAAHCTVPSITKVYVRAGSIYLTSGGILIFVPRANIVNHPDFHPVSLAHDISVLHLTTRLQFSSAIQPINLPTANEAILSHENAMSRVSGWGLTNQHGGSSSEHLRFVDLRVISNAVCRTYYRGQNQIQNGVLCAVGPNAHLPGGQNQGHCSGDSGGPLVIYTLNRYVQIGVVSFSAQGGDCLRKPSGFTRIGWFLNFIQQAVNKAI